MPSADTLLVFALLSLGLAATPGPNMLYLVSRSLAQGTGAGMVSMVGCQFGSLLIMLAAASGLVLMPLVLAALMLVVWRRTQRPEEMTGPVAEESLLQAA